MEGIIEKKLKEGIFSDDYEYFFSFLTDRFEAMVGLWINELEKRFNKKFKPIWVLSTKQKESLMKDKENYIIINTLIEEKFSDLKNRGNNLCIQEEPDDLNRLFSNSKTVKNIIDRLAEKQDRIFILSWTNVFFSFDNPKIIFLGPKPEIVFRFDSKVEQINVFKELNLPRNESKIYENITDIEEKERYPFFISATYSSGGFENGPIFSKQDLEKFNSNLRLNNKYNKFVVSKLIKDVKHSPNVSCIVLGENKTQIICITDQILRQHKYLGNIYPSILSDEIKDKIIEVSKKIGNYMSFSSFRGVFGLDFIVDSKNNLYTVDLNPRRQGGYLCNVLMSNKINLIELELKIALGEELSLPSYEDFQVDYIWGHVKLKPYYDFTTINSDFDEGNVTLPFTNKGSIFKVLYYPTDSIFFGGCVGYLIKSGDSYKEVLKCILSESETIISECFNLYTI
ncbi:MAG: ATP-grasp domain-containing protein [Candidatus Woesearchaeota archaeon]